MAETPTTYGIGRSVVTGLVSGDYAPFWQGEMGHVVLTVLGMVAQMERRFIKERQREGIERAKAVGAYSGGKRRIDRTRIKQMTAEGNGPSAIARILGSSRMQVYRVLQKC